MDEEVLRQNDGLIVKRMAAGVDRNIVMLGFVSFFVDFTSAMISPLLPIYVVEVLGATYFEVGLMVAVASMITYATRLLSGYVSDRYRLYKPLVVAGYLLSSLAKPLFAFVGTWIGAAVLHSLERFGKGVREAPKDALISSFVQGKNHGRSFGFHKMLDTLGSFFGALTLFMALYFLGQDAETMRGIFLATLPLGAVGVFLVWRYVADVPSDIGGKGHLKLGRLQPDLLMPIILFAGFTLFIFTDAFFILRAKEIGFDTATVPLLFMVFTLAQAVASYPIGHLVDRAGSQRVLTLAYFSGVLSVALFLEGSRPAVWLGFAFFGFYTVGSLNAVRSIISARAVNKSIAFGVLYTVLAAVLFVSSTVIGALWEHYGSSVALWISLGGTLTVAAAQLLYAWYHKR